MSNVLVLLTNQFPYDTETGEMYLEQEIHHITRIFDKVIVCPTDAQKTKDTGLINEDIKVISKQTRARKTNKFINLVRAIFYYAVGIYKKLDPCLLDEYVNLDSLKKRIFFYYFYSRTKQKYEVYFDEINKEIGKDDHVCFYSYRLFDTASMAIMLKESVNAKKKMVISRAHRYDLYSNRNILCYLPQRMYLYKNIDYLFPCSDDGRAYLLNDGCNSGKVLCSYLGSSATAFKSVYPSDTVEVLSLSTNSPVKRLNLIADTIVELSKRCKNIKWTHIGGGVEQLIAENQRYIDAGIMYFTGKKNHDEAMEIIRSRNFELFINLSSSEGLPQAIMEAYSYGIPSVATDVGGTREIVDDDNGFLISVDMKACDIANVIYEYIHYPMSVKMEYRKAAYRKWETQFDVNRNAIEFISFIKHNLDV